MAVVDQKTPRLGLLLPYTDNFLQDDVERLRQTLNLLDVVVVARDPVTNKIADNELSAIIAKLDATGKLLKAQLPSTVVQTGTDGKIDASLMPSIAVVDTFPVPDEASMLGLTCERGDIAIRTDLGKTYILTQMPPSVLSNWRELTSTNVTSVNGKTGAVTGLAASGNNSDITGFTRIVNFSAGATGIAATGDDGFITKKQFDDALKPLGAGGYIGQSWWHPSRLKLEGGTLPADGQIITTAKVLYPELVALIQGGLWPSTTEATWLAQPTARAAYVYDSVADTLRMPDLNGVQTGSIPAPVMRGDGGGLAPGSMQKSGVPNVAGEISGIAADSAPLWNTAVLKPPFKLGGVANKPLAPQGINSAGNDRILLIDLSTSSDVYTAGLTEARMNSVVGCYVIRVATKATNGGSVDMLALQSSVEALRAAAVATDSKIGYALLAGGTTDVIGTSQRIVLVNPFGVNTPVVCLVEVKINNVWCTPGFIFNPSVGGLGASAYYREGEGIVVQGGSYKVAATAPSGGSSGGSASAEVGSAIYRVHVWSIGKDISKLKQISQIDPALIAEFKAPVRPTGVRQVWVRTATETGANQTFLTFNESLLGKRVYLVADTANKFAITFDVPAVPLPLSPTIAIPGLPAGSFTVAAAVDNASWLIGISPDGLAGKVVATTISVSNMYVDDYTPA